MAQVRVMCGEGLFAQPELEWSLATMSPTPCPTYTTPVTIGVVGPYLRAEKFG